eukprot:4987890-Prymnesium_polylepis.1
MQASGSRYGTRRRARAAPPASQTARRGARSHTHRRAESEHGVPAERGPRAAGARDRPSCGRARQVRCARRCEAAARSRRAAGGWQSLPLDADPDAGVSFDELFHVGQRAVARGHAGGACDGPRQGVRLSLIHI